MAVKIENDCVCCETRCIGNGCPNRSVPHYFCDKCGDEISKDAVYSYQDEEVCEDCLKDMCKKEW